MKHRSIRFWPACAAAALLFGARAASAQVTPAAGYTPPDDTPKIAVGVTIFADYTYQDAPTVVDGDKNTIHKSSFNLTRGYINVTGSLSHWFSFRITPDIKAETGTGSSLSGNQTFRIKYGYGQVNFDDFAPKGSWLRFGLQQTPYLDPIEGVYRYRFQGATFTDVEGFLTSSDYGVSARVAFPDNYGDVHLGFYLVSGERVHLTKKEFDLLWLLIGSRGRVVTRDAILARLWDYDADVETRTVDVHIRALRRKLGDERIETVVGLGYRYRDGSS